jgi:hypothetical protein
MAPGGEDMEGQALTDLLTPFAPVGCYFVSSRGITDTYVQLFSPDVPRCYQFRH